MPAQRLNGRVRSQRYDFARRCEEGLGARCNCRCRGEHHGRRRIDFDANPFGLAQLPADDPHYVPLGRHPAAVRLLTPVPEEIAHA